MNWLFYLGLNNTVGAMLLALLVWGITRKWNNPPAAHLMWLLVLVKLMTPSLLNLDVTKWASTPEDTAPHTAVHRPLVPPFPQSRAMAPSDVEHHSSPADTSGGDVINDSRSALAVKPHVTSSVIWSAIRPVLLTIWMGGASLVSLLAAIRMVRFQRMLTGTLPASQRIQSLAAELANRMELRRTPDVRVVDSAIAPLVWCMGWRTTVVLPLRLIHGLDEAEIAMVLVHELAHLRRRDHWVRVIELITSALYWWNPLVGWIRRRLHAVEEHCCDAWVAWIYPDQSHFYAETLLKAAEVLPADKPLPAFASPFLNAHTLKERIEMVLKNRPLCTISRSAAVWLALLTIVVISAGIRGARGG